MQNEHTGSHEFKYEKETYYIPDLHTLPFPKSRSGISFWHALHKVNSLVIVLSNLYLTLKALRSKPNQTGHVNLMEAFTA